jgi:diacylglycerol kinase
VFKTEQNFRIQVFCAIIVLGGGLYFSLSTEKRLILLMMVTLVLLLEIINTALERFTDLLKPRLHHYVSVIKDIMAGAVLLASLSALGGGIMIFFPYLVSLWR